MKMLCAVLISAVVGCTMFPSAEELSVPGNWIVADRATFNAVAPVILALTDSDPSNDPDLTGVNATALRHAVQTWQIRLQMAERQLAESTP